ncbi:hypothetical protein HELRODRAFT_116244 [Helobdella robusta]|uniref:Phosphatidylinositol-3-phosphatase SAC1 n=1 Tax=Helobdella robusta TaxID=6412 RepID=T1EGD7_HELRO|nr:hypothetical protein HELRODRAFT_116244 [Helobdella robusta]ESN91957.1 hypothetical protein HELRODRAFT_116244 [Helobdella robusta]
MSNDDSIREHYLKKFKLSVGVDTSKSPIHQNLRIHITNTHFYVEALTPDIKEILIIDRVTNELKLSKNPDDIPKFQVQLKSICGIFGIIRLLAGPYLIVITRKIKVGEIDGKAIWKVAATELLPYQRTTLHLNEQQVQDNARYLSMVEAVLSMENFYFSTSYDLTHTFQRLFNTSPDFKSIALHDRADQRFLWNGFVLKDLSQQFELSSFCLPIMLGFISVNTCSLRGHILKYILISRRSCFRAGTRYNIRGIDDEGNVANFVETEQIIEFNNIRCSYVQTRGSVPLYWSQLPNLKYKPLPAIIPDDHLKAFTLHMEAQIYNYGKQVLVNLLDQKRPEIQLVDAYRELTNRLNNPQISHVAFDFHKECKNMQWHKLQLLLDILNEHHNEISYFFMQDSIVEKTQNGVFRTNCIDCLDRTNVVQSMIAKKVLLEQLKNLRILMSNDSIENFVEFETIFRNAWADNADACAKQYAGTGALKTDFTRTGKRTILGALQDGWNSAKRYFINNFYDGFGQDSQDLFLGNYEVEPNEGITVISPLRSEKDWKFYALPTIFMVAFSMCVVSVLIPDEHISEQLMYVLFWGGASAVTAATMLYYGREFVDRPKLVQRKLKTE